MKILITSGFLGAGKTTFIKEIIRRTGTFPVVLENEYGDNSIDAKELQSLNTSVNTSDTNSSPQASGGKLEILEFMEGCVCCTKKDSFVNSVLAVFSTLSPEYLIIEPTGVGKLSNIISNLKPLLHGDVTLLNPVVVLAPRSYKQNMSEWKELYEDQVANAQKVVFSKCENESAEIINETIEAIRQINPNAEIIDRHYSQQDDAWWKSLLDVPNDSSAISAVDADDTTSIATGISQVTLNNARLDHPGQLIMMLEDCLRGQLGHIARAKGTIPVGGETLRFDLADGLYSIAETSQEANQCVFIGEFLDRDNIYRRMGDSSIDALPAWNAPTIAPKPRPQIKVS